MGLLVSESDFVGKYKIARTEFSNIDSYIAKYEEQYLKELMGVELFKLFKGDVDSMTKMPVTPIYLNLYNPISEDDAQFICDYYYEYLWMYNSNRIRLSDGLKEMLLGFIYFEYMRNVAFKATPSGSFVNKNENAREGDTLESQIYNRYNEGIKSYHTIQWYILKNKADYSNFNGIQKRISGWL